MKGNGSVNENTRDFVARWAAFTCDPCPERLALYNASAAVCRTIRRNEREGW